MTSPLSAAAPEFRFRQPAARVRNAIVGETEDTTGDEKKQRRTGQL